MSNSASRNKYILVSIYFSRWMFFYFEFNVNMGRSHKEKRSSYAPEKGVRYDGIYRIEKCWRKKGMQVKFLWSLYLLRESTRSPHCKMCFLIFFFLFLFPIRGTRFVDIFLSDVTMNLHRGQGVSASLSLYLPIFLKIIIFCKWTCSDNLGDRPRPLPFIKEIENAIDITERRGTPSWDYDVSLCSFTLYNPRDTYL